MDTEHFWLGLPPWKSRAFSGGGHQRSNRGQNWKMSKLCQHGYQIIRLVIRNPKMYSLLYIWPLIRTLWPKMSKGQCTFGRGQIHQTDWHCPILRILVSNDMFSCMPNSTKQLPKAKIIALTLKLQNGCQNGSRNWKIVEKVIYWPKVIENIARKPQNIVVGSFMSSCQACLELILIKIQDGCQKVSKMAAKMENCR